MEIEFNDPIKRQIYQSLATHQLVPEDQILPDVPMEIVNRHLDEMIEKGAHIVRHNGYVVRPPKYIARFRSIK